MAPARGMTPTAARSLLVIKINSTISLIHTLPEAAAAGCAARPAAPGDPRAFRLLFPHHRNPKYSTFGVAPLALHSGLCRKASHIGRPESRGPSQVMSYLRPPHQAVKAPPQGLGSIKRAYLPRRAQSPQGAVPQGQPHRAVRGPITAAWR